MPSTEANNRTFVPLSERVLNIPEAAGHLRISRVTLYKLIGEGKIKPTKIGARTLIRGCEVERFLKSAEKRG